MRGLFLTSQKEKPVSPSRPMCTETRHWGWPPIDVKGNQPQDEAGAMDCRMERQKKVGLLNSQILKHVLTLSHLLFFFPA